MFYYIPTVLGVPCLGSRLVLRFRVLKLRHSPMSAQLSSEALNFVRPNSLVLGDCGKITAEGTRLLNADKACFLGPFMGRRFRLGVYAR